MMTMGDQSDGGDDGENIHDDDEQVRLPRRQPGKSKLRRPASVSSGIFIIIIVVIIAIIVLLITI